MPNTAQSLSVASRVHIRWQVRRDVPDILAIEAASFAAAWDEDTLLRACRQRHTIAMVADLGDLVVAYMVYELHRGRYHLIRLAVDPGFRRQGVGRRMVAKMVGKLGPQRPRLAIHVREGNLTGQQFLRSVGLRAERVLREHFADTGEDAYAMGLDIGKEVMS